MNNKIHFEGEKLPYIIRAKSERYIVASRKLNRKEDNHLLEFEVQRGAYRTKKDAYQFNKNNPVYTILDLKENVRSTDNLVFGIFDYFSEDDCKECIKQLESGDIGLSHRHMCEIKIIAK